MESELLDRKRRSRKEPHGFNLSLPWRPSGTPDGFFVVTQCESFGHNLAGGQSI